MYMTAVDLDNVPDCMFFFLAKAYQKSHGLIKKQLKPHGLTNLQHLVLEGLWLKPGMTAADLGKLLILDKATLSGVLDRMEEGGWIERRRTASDRRALKIYPAARAAAKKETLIQLRRNANEHLMARFSLEERLLLKRMLIDLFAEEG
jgi:DNA-binding MarR family transcriptional regulator